MLSPTLLEDRVWIDEFQAISIAIRYLIFILFLLVSLDIWLMFSCQLFFHYHSIPVIHQRISSWFTFQPLPTQHTWSTVYQKISWYKTFSSNVYIIMHLFPSLILKNWLLLIVKLLLTIYFVLLMIDVFNLNLLLFLVIIFVVSLF